jgi:hypothetical protein
MVPKFYIPMNNFPKLPSRKSDRKTLVARVQTLEQSEISQYFPSSSLDEPIILVESPVYNLLQAKGIPRDSFDDVLSCPPGQVEVLHQGQREEQFWNLMTVCPLPSGLY